VTPAKVLAERRGREPGGNFFADWFNSFIALSAAKTSSDDPLRPLPGRPGHIEGGCQAHIGLNAEEMALSRLVPAHVCECTHPAS